MSKTLCDSCEYADCICLTTLKQVRTENDQIISCERYVFDMSIRGAKEAAAAIQSLVCKGVIRSGRVVRSHKRVVIETEPVVPTSVIIAEMAIGPEMNIKEES